MNAFSITNKSGSVNVTVWAKNSNEACSIVWDILKIADKRSTLITKQINGAANKFKI